ncbi:MAG: Gfo/Idh/MocA family oxidoreductase [Gammaproteobacteria bacterium]
MTDTNSHPTVAQPRVAVVGSGYWGRNLVRNFAELEALDVVCDTNESVTQSFQAQYPLIRYCQAYAEVLGDDNIDGVVIATPAATHAALAREALLAQKHVFVEKPLALTEREGHELAQLARERSLILMVGHVLWYHPAVIELRSLIRSGELGQVRYVYSNRLNMGKVRREENVLWSFAPHDVSVILGLFGEMPESVQAQGGNYLHQRIADTTVTLLDFASGARAHIFVSWLHPFKEQKLVVVGERKMAVFDDTAPWPEKLTLYPHSVQWDGSVPIAQKADAETVPLEQQEPLKNECRHFLECIQTGAKPRTDASEGLGVLKVMNACEQALSSGRKELLAAQDARYYAHETAVVDADVSIGRGTRIWHFSHILSGSRLGQNCNVGQNVVIGPQANVGDGCRIQNNVSVYKGVTLEEDVFCGPSMVFTNVVNPRAHISRKEEFAPTLVRKGATIGANATILCGLKLGRYCFIGAGAVVTADVPAHALMVGNPARRIGWMCHCGKRLGDDLTCQCGEYSYEQSPGGLQPSESSEAT